jgi:hypothetical protein
MVATDPCTRLFGIPRFAGKNEREADFVCGPGKKIRGFS